MRIALLAACLALWMTMSAQLFAGLWDPDDYLYARYANDWRIGVVALPDWYAPRVAVTLPAAAAFALFGASDVSACAWPWLASTGTLLALFACMRRLHGEAAGWIAVALLATSPGFAFRGGALRPDAVLCFGLFGAVAAWLEAAARGRGAARAGWLVACAGLAFVAHLAREVALPLLGTFWLVYVAATRSLRRDHAIVAVALLALLGAEAVWLARATGDPMYRFHVLSDYARGRDDPLRFGFYVAPLLEDWLRLPERPPLALGVVPAAILAAACARVRRIPVLLLAWLAAWWLCLELAPSQLLPYRPAFKEARYALPLAPLLAGLTAFALAALVSAAAAQASRGRGVPDLAARAVAAVALAGLVLGALAIARRPPQQRVLDHLVADAAGLARAQQPYREVAERLRAAPPGPVYVQANLEGSRLARAVAFHLRYPDDAPAEPAALVPGSRFQPMEGRGAMLGTRGYALLGMEPARRAKPGWQELYRSPGDGRVLALYSLGSLPPR